MLTRITKLGGPLARGGCSALFAGLLVFATACGGGQSDIVPGSPDTEGTADCQPGITWFVGFAGFATTADSPQTVNDVRVLGVPSGLRVVGIYALSLSGAKNSRIGLISKAHVLAYRRPERYYPVSHAVLLPEGQKPIWYFVIEIKAASVGDWRTTGLAVSDASGTQTFPDRVEVKAVASPSDPAICPADP